MKNKLKNYYLDVKEILQKREMSVLPGHLAFYFLISLVPILTLIVYFATSFSLSLDIIKDFIKESFSIEVYKSIVSIVKNNTVTFNTTIVLLIAIIISSNGAHSIIIASNTVFDIDNSAFLRRRIKALVITLIFIVLFMFILVVPLFGETILKAFSKFGVDNAITYSFNVLYPILKWPISLFVIFFFIKFIYTIAPDENIPSKYMNKGALFTTFGWLILSYIYSFYINEVALNTYSTFYGSLSNVIIILFWFFLMSYVFVVGLILNYKTKEKGIEETNALKLKEISDKVRQANLEKINKKS